MNELDLLKIKKDSQETFEKEKNENFSKAFNNQWESEKPLRVWAQTKLFEGLKELGEDTSRSNLRHIGLRNDNRAAAVISEFKMNHPEYKEKMREAQMIYENNEFVVTGCIDYDMDTTLLKFFVRSKITEGLFHRDMIEVK